MQSAPVPPIAAPLLDLLKSLWESCETDISGTVASYIPELTKADPNWFGLCLMTVDGAVYEVGDSRQEFTIQSISKPVAYALALESRGPKYVRQKVGVEPSGEAFNSIRLEAGTGRPLNPMINAGAITVSSMVRNVFGDKAEARMLEWFSTFAGRELQIDHAVYKSESDAGHRNRAIAHLLRNFGIVPDPVEAGLDLYFRQCSILVNCHDLAAIGATLANRGIHPTTRKRAVAPDHVDDLLSVMTTCGMYDYAGQWLHEVGLPAKSGVAGGIVAVLPGRMGIGVFSPRLDAQGNSVRGIQVCRQLSERFRLHLFDSPRTGRATVRSHVTLAARQSSHVRSNADMLRLRQLGHVVHIFELQGDLGFATMEAIHRKVCDRMPFAETIVFDIARIDSADETAAETFGRLIQYIMLHGKQAHVAGLSPKNPLARHLTSRCEPSGIYTTLDEALEQCEEMLLAGHTDISGTGPDGVIPLEKLEVAQNLTPDALVRFEEYLGTVAVDASVPLFRKGDAADHIYFLVKGSVSVRISGKDGAFQRLATFRPGTVFGEMSVVDRGTRSTDIWAETEVECRTLSLQDFERMGDEDPALKFQVLEYLIRVLSGRLRKANEQITVLGSN